MKSESTKSDQGKNVAIRLKGIIVRMYYCRLWRNMSLEPKVVMLASLLALGVNGYFGPRRNRQVLTNRKTLHIPSNLVILESANSLVNGRT